MGMLSLIFGSKKEKEKLKQFLTQKHIIIDVRTENEYKIDHIKQAIHIPLGELGNHLEKIKSHKKPVVVYCQSGVRSAAGVGLLRKNGIDAVNGGGLRKLQKTLQA
ncbi:rhodanese-like domain-containing protein [Spongiivirga citrea]|uniref:Rhodanese-like domain-containing protein n=1 Tax=Spongiivirga citrea TaxID=1481457 RepID=A0A6M0CLB2_9FLAO|nr:rhodanese-like domain-containing protein [Spongiivirga citrea]NER18726.1 rhodanese-like domain-containing protein [Spongiivirga citrea]